MALLLASGVALVSGCAGRGRGTPVRIVLDSVPGTVDPHHHNELVIWSLVGNVCDGLVSFAADMQLEPALAESWEQLSPTRVRFRLRPGVVFHDGSPLTAADVVASFERARRFEGSGIRHHLVGIESVTADGERAVIIVTATPAPTLLNRLAFLLVVPARQAAEEEITAPIGTGPYRFVGRTAEGAVRLEAFDGWRGRPEIAAVEFTADPDDDERARALLTGRADVVRRFPEAQIGEVPPVGGLRTEIQPGMPVRLLSIAPAAAAGDAGSALADRRVRRAMLMAIDRARLVERAFNGNGIVASQYVHPVVFGYDPAVAPLPYDPQGARELLAEAGFADGFSTELSHGQLAPAAVAPLIEDLAAVGIRVESRPAPFSELLQRAGEVPLLYYARTCTTADASDILDSLLHSSDPARGYGAENWGGYSNPRADELIEAADAELDPQRRLALLQRAQRVVLEDLPVLPLAIRWSYLGLSGRVAVPTRYDEWLWVAGFHWRRPE